MLFAGRSQQQHGSDSLQTKHTLSNPPERLAGGALKNNCRPRVMEAVAAESTPYILTKCETDLSSQREARRTIEQLRSPVVRNGFGQQGL